MSKILIYNEYYHELNIPEPDKTILIGGYASGEIFRSGVTYQRGNAITCPRVELIEKN